MTKYVAVGKGRHGFIDFHRANTMEDALMSFVKANDRDPDIGILTETEINDAHTRKLQAVAELKRQGRI